MISYLKIFVPIYLIARENNLTKQLMHTDLISCLACNANSWEGSTFNWKSLWSNPSRDLAIILSCITSQILEYKSIMVIFLLSVIFSDDGSSMDKNNICYWKCTRYANQNKWKMDPRPSTSYKNNLFDILPRS